VTTQGLTATHHRSRLIEHAQRADTVRGVFGAASERLRRLVPFDAAAWLATDPATGLPTSPTRTENMGHFGGREACLAVWELEFLVEDVNLFIELARSERPAAGLRMATQDRPARSPRYRCILRPHGFGDELRAVLRADGSPWASVSLFRAEGRPAFDARERDLVAGLSSPLGEAVRDHARPVAAPAGHTADHGPGLMLFDPGGRLISVNDDALAWLDELADELREDTSSGIGLPIVVVSTLVRARAIAAERDHRTARARLRAGASGRWLVCHASCLRDLDGEIGNTALVIEPAKASEIAPIITHAYGLTRREQEITQLIARGFNTAGIAGRLHLSGHTVRDYVKAIFDKVGVSSRGELVATIFEEHSRPLHLDPTGVERLEH